MKKNRMMRLASVLLICVLLTTSVVGGTFAKYVTTQTGTDTARVAKWGVTITANGMTFANSYKNDEKNGTSIVANAGTSVKAIDDKAHVVAPGTKGELVSASITGKPEVAVRVEYEPTLTLEKWKVEDKEYCPLIFTVTKGSNRDTYGIKGMKDSNGSAPTIECDDISKLQEAVVDAIGAFSEEYAPNTDLSTKNNTNKVQVSWEWAFDKNDDAKDTALGNAENKATVKLEIKTTVTQID